MAAVRAQPDLYPRSAWPGLTVFTGPASAPWDAAAASVAAPPPLIVRHLRGIGGDSGRRHDARGELAACAGRTAEQPDPPGRIHAYRATGGVVRREDRTWRALGGDPVRPGRGAVLPRYAAYSAAIIGVLHGLNALAIFAVAARRIAWPLRPAPGCCGHGRRAEDPVYLLTAAREMRLLLYPFTGGRSARPGTPRHCLPSRAARSRGCAARCGRACTGRGMASRPVGAGCVPGRPWPLGCRSMSGPP